LEVSQSHRAPLKLCALLSVSLLSFALAFICRIAPGQTVEWTRQLGTSRGNEQTYGVAADGSGSAYVSGYTGGALAGPNAGYEDAFLAKYDDAGQLLWTRQFGTKDSDAGVGVSADHFGNVYVTGEMGGYLGSAASVFSGNFLTGIPSGSTAFLRRYDSAGNLIWNRQFGSAVNNTGAIAHDVSTDSFGNVFIAGVASGNLVEPKTAGPGAFVSKYDASGNLIWSRKPGLLFDNVYSVAADPSGNVYIAGFKGGNSSGAFVAKYDGDGNFQWVQQLGRPGLFDIAWSVSADSQGNVFVAGKTDGTFTGSTQAGGPLQLNAFVIKLDSNGSFVWAQQQAGFALGASADGLGNVYISGAFSGGSSVAKYGSAGQPLWTQSLSSFASSNTPGGLADDGMGNIYFAGQTTHAPYAFLAKIHDAPEPSTLALAVLGGIALLIHRRSRD
jgi:hypothetical protein